MTEPETFLKLPRTRVRQIIQVICGTLMLLLIASPLPAVDLLYVTLSNYTIASYDTTGNNGTSIAATLATFASTNSTFTNGLAFDSSGNLFAANPHNSMISKFNSFGIYESNIISNLINPRNLAFDSSGNLYAANYTGSTISKFNSAGIYQSNITSNLNRPNGLVFDSLGTSSPRMKTTVPSVSLIQWVFIKVRSALI